MKDAIIQILMGVLGTLGFNILFHIKGKKLIFATLGGLISWTVFLAAAPILPSESARYLLSAVVITVYGELLARLEKTPTTTFLVPSVVPLIPGSSLYYTMNYALNRQWSAFAQRALYTLELAMSLAIGILVVTTAFRLVKNFTLWLKKHRHV